ncbi:MAG: LEA type 2 family protein [Flavobacteriales bacterium]|jgi:LEA14-like dessication related protein
MIKNLYYLPILILILSISSCSIYEEVEMLGVEGYSFQKMEDNQSQASIVFNINNPNFYSIKLKKSSFEVFLDDKKLGDAVMADEVVILKKTEGDYTLNLLLNDKDLRNAAMPLLAKALFKKNIKLTVKGKAKCKVFGVLGKKIDINESKTLNLSELLNKIEL